MLWEPEVVRGDPRYVRVLSPRPVRRRVWNLNGVDWSEADPPPYEHTHWAQTVAVTGQTERWRCACGASAGPGEDWEPARVPRAGTPPRGCLAAMAAVAVVVTITGVWAAAAGRAKEWVVLPLALLIAWILLTLIGLAIERRLR